MRVAMKKPRVFVLEVSDDGKEWLIQHVAVFKADAMYALKGYRMQRLFKKYRVREYVPENPGCARAELQTTKERT